MNIKKVNKINFDFMLTLQYVCVKRIESFLGEERERKGRQAQDCKV